jgi:DNA-binding transcriptional MocR family regulator
VFLIDRSSTVPLADQVETRLRALIERGALSAGVKLPSIRQLAAQLGVSANTVVTAYDRLVAAALIESRGTAGFVVCESAAALPDAALLEAGEEQEPVWLAQQANDQRAGVLPASSGALPASWLADAIPATLLARAMARSPGGMASRCPPQGLPALRERIALLMRGQGIAVDANRVLTTSGGTQAIDLIVRCFVRPGDTVLVEDPGYFLLFGRLRQSGVRMLPITRRPDGIDLEQLEAACREHRPKVLFIQSVLHNPTGWGSSAANLHRVLLLAERHGVLVAEDDVHGHFLAGPANRLAQLSGLSGVVYYSSMCKALSPALRIGYLAADAALLKPLLREKICSTLTGAALNEYVLLEVLAAGRLRKHLDRLQQKLVRARTAAAALLREAGIVLDHPGEGGLFLWGRVPQGVDIDLLVKDAFRNQILLARGDTFMADGESDPHLRFNVVFSQNPRLAEYLGPRLAAVSQASATLARVAAKGLS